MSLSQFDQNSSFGPNFFYSYLDQICLDENIIAELDQPQSEIERARIVELHNSAQSSQLHYEDACIFLQQPPTKESSRNFDSDMMDNSSTSLHHPQKEKKIRKHLLGKRRTKDEVSSLQKSIRGYWTKNFLQFGTKPHLEFLREKKGTRFMKSNDQIKGLIKKTNLSMDQYQLLYTIPELQDVWNEFFDKKVIYRSLMLSRVQKDYRVVFMYFLDKFEKAFRDKKFIGISRDTSRDKEKCQNNQSVNNYSS